MSPLRKGSGALRPRSGSLPLLGAAFILTLPACEPSPDPVLGGAATRGGLDAIRLALEDDQRSHGPLPSLDTVLIVEVSSLAGPALGVAQELAAARGMAAVIGHANSPASLATSQVYNRRRIVQIAPTATASLYSEAGAFSFRMVPPDDHQGEFLAEVLERSAPAGGRVALLYVNDDYGRGLRHALVTVLDPDLFPVIVDLPHTEGDLAGLDLEHHLGALAAADPDLLVWLGRVPPLDALLPELRERMGDLPVLGGDALSRADILGERGDWWNGVRYLDFVDMDATPELRGFRERYRSRFGAEVGGPEALTYDAARLLVSAVRDGARSGEEIREHLMSLGRERPAFSGITGPIEFDENGDVTRDYVVREIQPREGS